MLLAFMYRMRGVLAPHHLATIYTFGSPAVFCETDVPEHQQSHSTGGQGSQGSGSKTHQPHTQALSPLTALTLEQVRTGVCKGPHHFSVSGPHSAGTV
jgi:hypothetical protein